MAKKLNKEDAIDAFTEAFKIVWEIEKQGKDKGTISCPRCNKDIHFEIDSKTKETKAKCVTDNCIKITHTPG